jgi:hypothetical protein
MASAVLALVGLQRFVREHGDDRSLVHSTEQESDMLEQRIGR